MFRQISAIFLLLAFSVQVFNRTVIMLDYYANTAAFAKNCENKARPMMHCNGQCVMMKKFREQEKKEQQNPERKGENKNEVISSRSYFTTITLSKIYIPRSFSSYLNVSISGGTPSDIFHPPGLV